jgi:hypothetical protein
LEYQNLVAIKKKLINKNLEKEIWNNTKLEDEIYVIIDLLSEQDFDFETDDILNYDPQTIDNKTDSSIIFLTKRAIHRNVQDYYSQINKRFSELDKIAPLTTETISSQIRTHYLRLAKQETKIFLRNLIKTVVVKNVNTQS